MIPAALTSAALTSAAGLSLPGPVGPVGLVGLFGAGVASFLAPCVLPLVPVYLTVLLGSAEQRTGWVFARATAGFVAGFTVVFAVLGAVAGAAVARVGAASVAGLDPEALREVLIRGAGLLLLIFALILMVGLPDRWQREWRLFSRLPRVTAALRPPLLGVAFGAAWTPCVGPLLGTALVLAGQSGGAGGGALLLVAYAAGIGAPFVVAALLLDSWPAVAVRLRSASVVLNRVSAVLVVALAGPLIIGRPELVGSLIG